MPRLINASSSPSQNAIFEIKQNQDQLRKVDRGTSQSSVSGCLLGGYVGSSEVLGVGTPSERYPIEIILKHHSQITPQ